ncbi:MAG: MarR family transcriptional regulator [Burkholderiales bacterium]|nr:MarR family transcriptional regulator [Burkholderiales bacterium]
MRKPPPASSPPPPPVLPRAGQGMRGADGHLGYLLRQAGTALRRRMELALADLAVTPPQFTVMTMLAAYPGASGADVARLALLTPQTLTVIVANLERAGLVARQADAAHGRIRRIALTAAGERLLRACRARVAGIEREMAAGLSAAEERAVRRWLARVAAAADGAG